MGNRESQRLEKEKAVVGIGVGRLPSYGDSFRVGCETGKSVDNIFGCAARQRLVISS